MDTDAVLDLLKETAATVITPRFRALSGGQVFEKAPGDLVTVADRESEIAIAAVLQAAYPDALVLGEEAASADASLLEAFAAAEHSFTIDPIDGTKNFVNGSPDHAVMVAEVRGGAAVRSWIWVPERAEAFVAEAGAGAYRNGVRIERPAVVAGLPLRGATSSQPLRSNAPAPLQISDSWMCAGVDYAKVALGEVEYVAFRNDWPWDHVPGALLLAEAGGFTGRLDGSAYAPCGPLTPWLIGAASSEVLEAVRGPIASLVG
ncbi:inositol monophosphatase [Occultella glacieicola]|uniref:Inositol monophosphatase n=1 Tax=Occultella glacieicola TaxID=2518684 RepID=A0ABY2E8H4_9MICO|nr:inositol monophosphatase [Occultella glacieicola]TDE94186.1 inositol monophosphatase [Occultella glacieicola]